jgi:PAT family beta-lactamase induction signal transducer AmpG
MTDASATAAKPGWVASLRIYLRPETRPMLFLGFAAGLPFLLVGGTLTIWLAEGGLDAKTLGFFAWVGFAYSFKYLWAPVVDRLPIPVLTRRFGRRRSWMLLAQIGVAIGLLWMAHSDPTQSLAWMAAAAVLVAFASATQDIALDAYRIESAPLELQGALSGAYQLGYRLAILASGAGALYLAEYLSWREAYILMAVGMAVGLVTVLAIREPPAPERPPVAPSQPGRFVFDAVIGPFVDFFKRHAWLGVVILALISLHRLSDFVIGTMAGKLYVDLGFQKPDIANVTKVYGFIMSLVGVAIGGVLVAKLGVLRALLVGAIVGPASNLCFAWLAAHGTADLGILTVTISIDNAASGLAGTTLIAYMSSLTSSHYTATQYALFSSFYALPGRTLAGFSGYIVEDHGYVGFFLYTAIAGIPALLLCLLLMAILRRRGAAPP